MLTLYLTEPHWHVPFGRNKQFVGRESELQEIIEKLNPESNEDDCQRVAIAGLGGIGKTQIALEAAFRIQKEFNDCSVFWVPAIDTTSFERAYQKMGQKLQIPGINEDKADVKSLVKEFLSQESAGRWLLIVDNADDVEMLYNRAKESNESCGSPALVDYLPFSRKGSILFTTRNRKVAVKQAGIDIVPLKEMSEIDSQKLLEMSLINKSLIEEKDTTTKLLKLLAHLPLAIKQAAAFLNENEISISDYLKIYESDNEQMISLLGKDFEDQGRYNTIKNPIVSTWLISFRQILRYNQLAAEYLYIMSCVAQQDIPFSLLPSAPILLQQEALGILKAYAFITPHKGQYSYDIHRLVQVAVRNWLKTRNELSLWSGKTLAQITRVFPFFKYENRDECTRYLPHALCILDFPEFSENFEEPLETLLCNIGEYFLKAGKYSEAEQRYRQALELREKVLGKDHLDTLMVKNKLATSLCHQDKYEEAEPMFRQTLQVRETVFGKDHPDTLVSMNNLALLLHEHHGKYIEAEAMHRQTLHIRERVLGKDHPNTLWSMSNLALSLFAQGKYTEAEAIERQTLQIRETVLGKDHPDTLISRNNLAGSLSCQSKDAEVEAMYRETIQVQATVLGNDHPDTLLSMNNLALTLYDQGKYAEAEPMFRQTLQARETVLGRDHPDTLSTRRDLALPLSKQGKYTEAEALYRQTLRVQEAVLGKDHPATRMTTNYLTEILRLQRENAEAEGISARREVP
jgi:tetratricopeptide (TPR) repeat protein